MGIAAILGLILPAIPSLIGFAENLIKGNKVGETRMDAVLQQIRALISGITHTTTPLPPGAQSAAQPTDDELRAVIETILAQIKATGALGVTPIPTGQMYLVRGSVIPLIEKAGG